jgi:hypothetical protein
LHTFNKWATSEVQSIINNRVHSGIKKSEKCKEEKILSSPLTPRRDMQTKMDEIGSSAGDPHLSSTELPDVFERVMDRNKAFVAAIAVFLFLRTGLSYWINLLILFVSWLFLLNGYRFCYLFAMTFRRDLRWDQGSML